MQTYERTTPMMTQTKRFPHLLTLIYALPSIFYRIFIADPFTINKILLFSVNG